MARDADDLRATCAYGLLMAMGRRLGLSVAYHAFGHAAEMEDQSEILRAAAWQALGRTIVVALASPSGAARETDLLLDLDDQPTDCGTAEILKSRSLFAAAPEVRRRTRHIAENLGILIDAGRKGGSISAASVHGVAQSLNREISALMSDLDNHLAPSIAPAAADKNQCPNARRS